MGWKTSRARSPGRRCAPKSCNQVAPLQPGCIRLSPSFARATWLLVTRAELQPGCIPPEPGHSRGQPGCWLRGPRCTQVAVQPGCGLGEPRVRGQRQELDELVARRDLIEQLPRLVVA